MFLLALTAVADGAARAAADALTEPPPARLGSPSSSVEPAAPRADEPGGIRGALELMVLALICAAAVAFYSITTGERGSTRVPARVRRR